MRRYDRLCVYGLLLAAVIALPHVSYAQDVSLDRILSRTDTRLEWDGVRGHGMLVRGTDNLSFTLHSATAVENGDLLHRVGRPVRRDGELFFTDSFFQQAVRIFPRREGIQPRRIGAIFIDPGHGGRDPGAIGRHEVDGEVRSLKEKDIVLDVSLRLERMLRQRYPDRQIVMSRRDDVYLTLEERTNRANEIPMATNESVLFISIHANASLNSRARGFEVWVLPPEFRRRDLVTAERTGIDDAGVLSILNTIREEEITLESTLLARSVLAGLDGTVGSDSPNRGIREESWYVVRNARMPSVLIELGFVTNREEFLLMKEEQYIQRLTEGVMNGVTSFVQNFEQVGQQ